MHLAARVELGADLGKGERIEPSDYLKEAMGPELWAWYSKYRRTPSRKRSAESNDD